MVGRGNGLCRELSLSEEPREGQSDHCRGKKAEFDSNTENEADVVGRDQISGTLGSLSPS